MTSTKRQTRSACELVGASRVALRKALLVVEGEIVDLIRARTVEAPEQELKVRVEGSPECWAKLTVDAKQPILSTLSIRRTS